MPQHKKNRAAYKTSSSRAPTTPPEKLVKSEEQDSESGKDDSYRSLRNSTSPRSRWETIWEWLHSKEQRLAVWLPVIISVVLLAITWVYARYAKKQWQTAVEQGQTMERSLNISERAYVAVENIKMDLEKGEITLTVHNVGKSPASDLRVNADAQREVLRGFLLAIKAEIEVIWDGHDRE